MIANQSQITQPTGKIPLIICPSATPLSGMASSEGHSPVRGWHQCKKPVWNASLAPEILDLVQMLDSVRC